MYLKNIKAHGFKSFADKINIELKEGITGIVGPNGSGKSNVVDAIRWVLGEQSVKSLRGEGTMSDVIFSGSKSRKNQNVASVTLVFDNQDHYLPVSYEEVSLKRRVYQDGTNEYFINGEKVRLKDMTDLLLDSGIAKESFNIISQGKIEEILSNKPGERRVVFEEAAGVLKYKKRKEEAFRKLERTNENRRRVKDILQELEIQVDPLKEQREKALLYQESHQQLEEIELALITKDITKFHQEEETAKQEMEVLNQELLAIATSNSREEARVEQYKKEMQEQDQKIKEQQNKLLHFTALVEQIHSQKQMLLERKNYEVEDSKLHERLVFLMEEQMRLEVILSQGEEELTILKNSFATAEETLKMALEEEQKVKLEKEKKTQLLSQLAMEERQKNREIVQLQEQIEHNERLPYAVKQILNYPQLTGIHHVIGNLLEVEEKYALALTTALGAASSYLVVDNELTAKEAISYLKKNRLGRATFFPLSVIKPKAIDPSILDSLKKKEGFLGVASSLIQYDKTYYNIMQNQLGNVLIVDALDHANIISKFLQYRYKIVTLEGELLHVGGSLTGGSEGKNRSIIEDRYELEEKLKQKEALIQEMKKLEEAINEQDQKLQAALDHSYLEKKKKLEQEEQIRIKQETLHQRSIDQKRIEEERNRTVHLEKNTISEEEEKLLASYYDAVKEKEQVTLVLKELENRKETINQNLEQEEGNLKLENRTYQEKNKRLKELEILINRLDVKLDTLLTTLNEEYNMTYEKAVASYFLDMEESAAWEKVRYLKQQIQGLGSVNLGAIAEYDRLKTRFDFLLSQDQDLENAQTVLLEIIDELDEVMKKEFLTTFELINTHFTTTFQELFKGGTATLQLTDPDHILETGIEIIASPPGKKLSTISLLSGGEKTFTAISLLFAILKSRFIPFCVLDEVEAALDEANVDSFGTYLAKLKEKTQFILITHKKKTMEYADVLYGITMQESGVSNLVSVKLETENQQ